MQARQDYGGGVARRQARNLDPGIICLDEGHAQFDSHFSFILIINTDSNDSYSETSKESVCNCVFGQCRRFHNTKQAPHTALSPRWRGARCWTQLMSSKCCRRANFLRRSILPSAEPAAANENHLELRE
uniref:Uncharacterized protein n=1 Tax=Knipowitschia caucasica TaxID=637954 RepID=A0AAV2LD94_KNICA